MCLNQNLLGERVVSETTFKSCGTCIYCKMGKYNLCNERRVLGYWVNGAFAKYCIVHQERIHRLPPNVDFFASALTEPLACCVHGVTELTGISPGEVVIVISPGAIGLLAMQVAKSEGGRLRLPVKDEERQIYLTRLKHLEKKLRKATERYADTVPRWEVSLKNKEQQEKSLITQKGNKEREIKSLDLEKALYEIKTEKDHLMSNFKMLLINLSEAFAL